MLPEEQKKIINEIKQLFDNAEKVSKSMETVIFEDEAGLDVTVINQLRYVGQHLLRYFSDPDLPIEELEKAKRHAQRALYDAHDCRAQFAINEIEGFEQDCRNRYGYILEVFPEYTDMLGLRDETLDFIAASADSRENYYDRLMEYASKLEKFVRKLPHIRFQINAKIELAQKAEQEEKEKEKKGKIWDLMSKTIIAIVSAIIGVIATYYFRGE
jgi:hypothetical protein